MKGIGGVLYFFAHYRTGDPALALKSSYPTTTIFSFRYSYRGGIFCHQPMGFSTLNSILWRLNIPTQEGLAGPSENVVVVVSYNM